MKRLKSFSQEGDLQIKYNWWENYTYMETWKDKEREVSHLCLQLISLDIIVSIQQQ
jgi:hypothetical protein